MSLVCLSPAKLNLFLQVTGRLSNGYHTLYSGLQYVTFCDTMEFSETEELGSLKLEMVSQLPGGELPAIADNLVLRAASKLQRFKPLQPGVKIRLTKRIPMGSGLGGGSSNAATTLLALNHLWKLQLTPVQLSAIGQELGADVPFFLFGRAALAMGTGEVLSPIDFETPWYMVACCFKSKISTARAFEWITPEHYQPVSSLKYGNPLQLTNIFESIVRREYPEIECLFQWGLQFGKPSLTGTGGALFMKFDSLEKAMCCAESRPKNAFVFITKGINRTLLLPQLFRQHDLQERCMS